MHNLAMISHIRNWGRVLIVRFINYLAGVCLLSSFSVFAKPVATHDIGLINKEQIVYWLKKRGELNQRDEQAALEDYIGQVNTAQRVAIKPRVLDPAKVHNKAVLDNKFTNFVSLNPTDDKTNVKVLAILIDFPDLPYDNNQLTAEDTPMYYSDYSQAHYQQMLFNDTSYPGPSGQSLNTVHHYYQQASGESFAFTGDVYGWVSADKPAKFYGEREGDIRDLNAPDLILEAVEKAVATFNINLQDYDLTDLDDIDGDGITNEPNGIIDHVMVFHSSIGEEAGGGVLGTDAIWSHRFFVTNNANQPATVAGSNVKLFGYTINPIDAGIGVVAHEFGHDLGLPDEYDLMGSAIGEPVASWSIMAGGSWAGSPRGSAPVMFSAYALDYLQTRYKGNWLHQTEIDLADVNTDSEHNLKASSSFSSGVNQLKVTLPAKLESFKAPLQGRYQYYSGKGNELVHSYKQRITLPSTAGRTELALLSHFSIEQDYDYAQIKVNGVALANSYTKAINPHYGDIGPYLSGDSQFKDGAKLPHGHLDMRFDLSAYEGQTIELEITYVTDVNIHFYGIVVDDLTITQGNTVVFKDDAEQSSIAQLAGFSRIGEYVYQQPTHYFLQLRDYAGIDSGLQFESYSPGVLLWYVDPAEQNNNTASHPGIGFALVVDADQNTIRKGTTSGPANTDIQVRDAAFSLYDQRQGLGDEHLLAISSFSDSQDYSFPIQPASGVNVPSLGFGWRIVSQATDSSEVNVELNYDATSGISAQRSDRDVSFSINGLILNETDTFLWLFGDGEQSTVLAPTHQYAEYGRYTVVFERTTESGEVTRLNKEIIVSEPLTLSLSVTANENGLLVATATAQGGIAPYQYSWDFADGGAASTATVSYQYALSGSFDVNVTVVDANMESTSSQFAVTVDVPLNASARFNAQGLNVQFSSQISGGTGQYRYQWDFADGSTSTSASPTHQYTNEGTYAVTLTVTDTQTQAVEQTSLSVTVVKTQSNSGSSGGAIWWLLLIFSPLIIRRYGKF